MTENQENQTIDTGFLNSKFGRTLLTIISVVLIFAGPTYVIYGLAVILKANLVASFAVGFVLLIVGLVMMRYLVKKNIVT
jgi:uncharacterized membrane protein